MAADQEPLGAPSPSRRSRSSGRDPPGTLPASKGSKGEGPQSKDRCRQRGARPPARGYPAAPRGHGASLRARTPISHLRFTSVGRSGERRRAAAGLGSAGPGASSAAPAPPGSALPGHRGSGGGELPPRGCGSGCGRPRTERLRLRSAAAPGTSRSRRRRRAPRPPPTPPTPPRLPRPAPVTNGGAAGLALKGESRPCGAPSARRTLRWSPDLSAQRWELCSLRIRGHAEASGLSRTAGYGSARPPLLFRALVRKTHRCGTRGGRAVPCPFRTSRSRAAVTFGAPSSSLSVRCCASQRSRLGLERFPPHWHRDK